MGPDPTRAYFWPAVNKRPTRLWPGHFLTRREEIIFDPKRKKLKIWHFIVTFSKFKPKPCMADPTWTEPQKTDPNGSKNFDPDPSLIKRHIFQFFALRVKKNLFGSSQKVPGSKAGQPLICCRSKYARVGSGPISSRGTWLRATTTFLKSK